MPHGSSALSSARVHGRSRCGLAEQGEVARYGLLHLVPTVTADDIVASGNGWRESGCEQMAIIVDPAVHKTLGIHERMISQGMFKISLRIGSMWVVFFVAHRYE